jgi:hypothetical protein
MSPTTTDIRDRHVRVARALAAELAGARSVVADANDPQRYLAVFGNPGQVEAYLPGRWRIDGHVTTNLDGRPMVTTLVSGADYAGWTVEEYLVPRLASGLYTSVEVTPDA